MIAGAEGNAINQVKSKKGKVKKKTNTIQKLKTKKTEKLMNTEQPI